MKQNNTKEVKKAQELSFLGTLAKLHNAALTFVIYIKQSNPITGLDRP
jgi:hypothetical protein